MEKKARLLYKSYMTYFNTFLPVYFYGMPNGKVYCIYARYYNNNANNSKLEFVFAENENLTYNYQSDTIFEMGTKVTLNNFKELVDQPEQRTRTLKIYSELNSYAEAQALLNKCTARIVNDLFLVEEL